MSIETEDERYSRYLQQNKGVFFASDTEMEVWAKGKVREGKLKALSSLVPGDERNIKYWYCVPEMTTPEDLLVYFNTERLNHSHSRVHEEE